MNKTFEESMEKLAELAVMTGVNLQEGQTLYIDAPVTAAAFVRKAAAAAYEAGAKNVLTDYKDEELMKLKFMKAPEEGLKEFPDWKAKAFEEMDKANTAYLQVYAVNPTAFSDTDPKRVSMAYKASASAMKKHHENISAGRVSWCIVSVPTDEWAEQVFEGEKTEDAVQKLWEAIFDVTRVTSDDPVQNWDRHISELGNRADYLNKKQFKKLYYKGPGTDLEISLPDGHIWKSAQFTNEQGISFIPNMPTEEVFTIPLKEGVNGTVASTKPLNYNGVLIKDFSLTFENGRVAHFEASEGKGSLKEMLDTDEGARYLGEVALVPHNSPISNSGILFYNTLFDENASCHLALGSTIPICLEGGTGMSSDELLAAGLNDSLTHVDFMIGSARLDIDGETDDGTREPVFRSGDWVFSI
ncbi:aminopeptidase [Bacillus marinisedimentorum]|uniref:aminopeptidase n=1 Tax=Bacillus marinisedimentorum TaxID=1821260 RepID=UPI0007E1646D|nr:aminopeptidase [Bacillus marinisedimentorum]